MEYKKYTAQERLRMEDGRVRNVHPYEYPTEGFEVIHRYSKSSKNATVSLTQTNDYAARQRLYIVTFYENNGKPPKVFVSNIRAHADKAYDSYLGVMNID